MSKEKAGRLAGDDNVIWYSGDTTLLRGRMKRYLDESGVGKQADEARKRLEETGKESNRESR